MRCGSRPGSPLPRPFALTINMGPVPDTGSHTAPGHGVDAQRTVEAANRLLGRPLDRTERQDIEQEVELALLGEARKESPPRDLEAWAFGAARLMILQRLRKRRREASALETLTESSPTSSEPGGTSRCGSTTRRVVRRAIDELGTLHRDIIVGRFIHGWSFGRIASALGMSLPAVRARYYRLVPRLESRLGGLLGRFQGPRADAPRESSDRD